MPLVPIMRCLTIIPSIKPVKDDVEGRNVQRCNKTFCSTSGTPYYRLHDRRSVFDEVVEMSVHGITISSISKIKKMTWNTIARWLKMASNAAQRFNNQKLKNFVIHELQADEIRTFIQIKKNVIWLYTTMDVWSRL